VVLDRSNHNVLTGNTIRDTGADSWVDVMGNAWLVSGNRGVHALLDGFPTHVPSAGWGCHNTAPTTGSGIANQACV
jgi:hypothetical protein